jgi:hypothetical protein
MHFFAVISRGAACVLALACGSSEPKPASSSGDEVSAPPGSPATSAPPQTAAPAATRRTHKDNAFGEALRARDAIIAGDLAAAKQAALLLARQDLDSVVPRDWRPWTQHIQQYARELTAAPNLGAAAQALGQIALECGDCHDIQQHGPRRIPAKPEPWRGPPEAIEERMLRHEIGAGQMWDGLVMPSEQSFRTGTITLERAPLTPPEQQGLPVDPVLNARIEVVRELAKQAQFVTTYAERGRVYGELIARCAGCHFYLNPPK